MIHFTRIKELVIFYHIISHLRDMISLVYQAEYDKNYKKVNSSNLILFSKILSSIEDIQAIPPLDDGEKKFLVDLLIVYKDELLETIRLNSNYNYDKNMEWPDVQRLSIIDKYIDLFVEKKKTRKKKKEITTEEKI